MRNRPWPSWAPSPSLLVVALLAAAVGELLMGQSGLTPEPRDVRIPLAWALGWALLSLPFAALTRYVLASDWTRVRRAAVLVPAMLLMLLTHAALDSAMTAEDLRVRLRSEAMVGVLVALTVYAMEYERVARQAREREREQQALTTRAQLETLRMQLDPHFLFNTLNALSTLIDDDPSAAHRMLDALADFLRETLVRAPLAEVPLRDEVALISRYLEIERVRFGSRLRVDIDVSEDAARLLVPTLLLQPLVENAVRHGIQPSIPGGTVTVRARESGDSLRIEVADDGVGMQARRDSERTGIGLRNTTERLRHSFGAGASLQLTAQPAGGTLATITLPRRRLPSAERGP